MTKSLGGQNEFAFVGIFFWAQKKPHKHLSIYKVGIHLVGNKTHQLTRETVTECFFL